MEINFIFFPYFCPYCTSKVVKNQKHNLQGAFRIHITQCLGVPHIGQGVNRSSQSQLAASAQNATQLKNAYTQAKAASKANTINTVASLGTAAILAFAI